MRYLALTLCLIGLLAVTNQAQSGLDLKNNAVKNDLLVEILNDSEMKELKPPTPAASSFFVRLYSIKGFGEKNCAPEVETEVACVTRYYLAISDGSLGVPGAVYDLGEVGEISEIKFWESPDSKFARLFVEITNYPRHAFELNPKLEKKTKNFVLDVNLNTLKIDEVRKLGNVKQIK